VTTDAHDYDSYSAELASYTAAREQGGAAGATAPYQGLWALGIKTYLQHRTLEECLDAFIEAGLRLMKLADSPAKCFKPVPDSILPEGTRFPRFLLLAFTKP
jgi:hypothetical protein